MKIDLQKNNESIIIKLDDGKEIEFTEEDLASLGIDADKAVEMIKDGLFETLVNNKRETLKKVASGGAIATLVRSSWSKPLLYSVVLPVHAQTSVNQPPVAADASISAEFRSFVTGDLVKFVSDDITPMKDLTISIITSPKLGTLVFSTNTVFMYIVDDEKLVNEASDMFQYQVTDGEGLVSEVRTIMITNISNF